MKTLFDAASLQELTGRLDSLTPAAQARWGKMNAEQMVAHLVESVKLGTGELTAKPKKTIFRYPPVRQLLVYLLPFPKGVPTLPELRRGDSDAGTLTHNRAELTRVLRDIASRSAQKEWPEHPAFGNLGRRAWGVLVYRHVDHHLRQFGV